jgi:pimeloyl-ACP methyl ester carboxylesterase
MGGFCLRCDRALTVFDDGPDDESLWPLFRSIRCPVLLMRGAASAHLQRSVAERMTRELPNCSLETIRNAGHAIMLDNPVGFIAALRRFITRLRIPTSGSGK